MIFYIVFLTKLHLFFATCINYSPVLCLHPKYNIMIQEYTNV